VCETLRRTAPCSGVRNRARYIGSVVDSMAAQRRGDQPLRVLSIAAGHGREMGLSEAFMRKQVEFAAIDLDSLSLQQMQEDYGECNLSVFQWHVKQLLQPEAQKLGKFDLVYSCGLYDYLPDSFAKKLTETLANHFVHPGGKLIFANFVDHYFRNFMEVFMDWHLIYRDVTSLESLTLSLCPNSVQKKTIWKDPSGTIVLAEIDFSKPQTRIQERSLPLSRRPFAKL